MTDDKARSRVTTSAEKPSCRHEWQPCDFHVCNVVPVEGKKHAHYVWSVCAKCGEGSILR